MSTGQSLYDRTKNFDGMVIILGEVICNAALAGVYIRAAQFFGGHIFTGGSFDKRRAAQKDRACAFYDNGFITHGRDVRAARRATAHHRRDLCDHALQRLRQAGIKAPILLVGFTPPSQAVAVAANRATPYIVLPTASATRPRLSTVWRRASARSVCVLSSATRTGVSSWAAMAPAARRPSISLRPVLCASIRSCNRAARCRATAQSRALSSAYLSQSMCNNSGQG